MGGWALSTKSVDPQPFPPPRGIRNLSSLVFASVLWDRFWIGCCLGVVRGRVVGGVGGWEGKRDRRWRLFTASPKGERYLPPGRRPGVGGWALKANNAAWCLNLPHPVSSGAQESSRHPVKGLANDQPGRRGSRDPPIGSRQRMECSRWLRLWVLGPEGDQEVLRGQVGRGAEAQGEEEQIRRIGSTRGGAGCRCGWKCGCGCEGGHAAEATQGLRQNARSGAESGQKKKPSQERDIFPPERMGAGLAGISKPHHICRSQRPRKNPKRNFLLTVVQRPFEPHHISPQNMDSLHAAAVE